MRRCCIYVLLTFLLLRFGPGIDCWLSLAPRSRSGEPRHLLVLDAMRRQRFAAPPQDVSNGGELSAPKLVMAESEEVSNLDDESTPAALVHHLVTGLATIVVLCATTAISWPFLSSAIDHPVDHTLLDIPSPVPDARFFVAGGACAAASHGITTPVDVVKTRMQTDPELRQAGLRRATLALLQQEGPGTLLQGLGPTVGGYGLEGALKFGLYESMKPAFADLLHTADTAVPYLLASVTAGAAASVVLCPMEQLRIRAVTDPSFGGLSTLVAEGGVTGLFRGLPSMLSKQVPYTFGKQVTFDEFASMLYTFCETTWGLAEAQIKYEVSIAAAFLASMAACVLSHPGDVVLTRTYQKRPGCDRSSSCASADDKDDGAPARVDFARVVQSIYEEQGAGGFWSGISARFVHVGVIVTSQLVLYDVVKQLLGLPATGAH